MHIQLKLTRKQIETTKRILEDDIPLEPDPQVRRTLEGVVITLLTALASMSAGSLKLLALLDIH
jgi:hypothetical protein